jgi:hypothetical protein
MTKSSAAARRAEEHPPSGATRIAPWNPHRTVAWRRPASVARRIRPRPPEIHVGRHDVANARGAAFLAERRPATPCRSQPMRLPNAVPRLPLRPLAAAFALALALDASAHVKTTPRSPQAIEVQNCNDAGPGSLRDAVNNAADGDTIDLTQLQCSTISLSTGAILIGTTGLTLQGPGAHQLTLSGAGDYGWTLLYDLGGGTLTIDGIDLELGSKYRSDNIARGGCVYTNGDLVVNDSHVSFCGVHANTYTASGGALYAGGSATITYSQIDTAGLTTSGDARGGCVFANGDVILAYSSLSGCRNATPTRGFGGALYAGGELVMKYSTIRDSVNDDAETGFGGGIYARGDTHVFWSTISGNTATVGGGIMLMNDSGGHSATISNSTISGNVAHAAGGIDAEIPLSIGNSTIAFNTANVGNTSPIGYSWSGGLAVRTSGVTITSTIVTNNFVHHTDDTLEHGDIGGDVPNDVGGGTSLVMDSAQALPPDTLFADPLLAPLADNGGLTKTHAVGSGSPAIDAGDDDGWDTDQRGAGFPRIRNARADIGAYEVDPDLIFRNGFD